MISFDLLRYFLVLSRRLKEELTLSNLNKSHPNYQWKKFLLTSNFKELEKDIFEEMQKYQLKLDSLNH